MKKMILAAVAALFAQSAAAHADDHTEHDGDGNGGPRWSIAIHGGAGTLDPEATA